MNTTTIKGRIGLAAKITFPRNGEAIVIKQSDKDYTLVEIAVSKDMPFAVLAGAKHLATIGNMPRPEQVSSEQIYVLVFITNGVPYEIETRLAKRAFNFFELNKNLVATLNSSNMVSSFENQEAAKEQAKKSDVTDSDKRVLSSILGPIFGEHTGDLMKEYDKFHEALAQGKPYKEAFKGTSDLIDRLDGRTPKEEVKEEISEATIKDSAKKMAEIMTSPFVPDDVKTHLLTALLGLAK